MASSCLTLIALSPLLILSFFIHESQSCPPSIHFNCPDNAFEFEGTKLLDFPFTNFSYPDCGRCVLNCVDDHTVIDCMKNPDQLPLQVLHIFPNNQTIVVEYPHDPYDPKKIPLCEAYTLSNASFRNSPSVSFTISEDSKICVQKCQHELDGEYCEYCGDDFVCLLFEDGHNPNSTGCIEIQVPNLYSKFSIHYNLSKQCQRCVEGKSPCQDVYGNFVCDPTGIPSTKSADADRREHSTKRHVRKIILVTVLPGLAIISVLVIVYGQRRKSRSASSALPSRISFSHTRSDLQVGMASMNGVTVFSYTELEEATNNFDPNRELGEGGFGVVYRGKLRDGTEVAVKRLFEKNYKRVEQFKNEIRILTNLRHQNLVTLYGSSTRHSRELLLVYEYIPNGTVADHLHGDKSNSILLRWSTRMNIAIETATALSYLHFNEVIHRDVKTNNILLDGNFCVKVADFGLSRLFPADVTHISTAPQGTPGYLDPEYHECYQLTNKSDVYSFGVVLIELISSLPAVDIGRHRHEFNLSDYAMNRIQCGAFNELVDPNLGFETDFKVRRMTTLVAEVAFRCLQQEKELRPTMIEVLEALKGINNVDYGALEADEMSTKTTHIMKPPPSPTDNEIVEPFSNTRQQP